MCQMLEIKMYYNDKTTKTTFPYWALAETLRGMLSRKRRVAVQVTFDEKLFKIVDLTNSLLPSLKAFIENIL